ncbi:MAG TPA: aldehyde dehydrogenase family protein [Terriglobales bacterium]|nr:aldehyde dehydrogenase family protein [Terriglobales bacterium]
MATDRLAGHARLEVVARQHVPSSRLISRNPATGEVLGEVPFATQSDVHQAVERARAAQPGWAATHVRERVAIFKKFQRLLTDHKAAVATLITREAGKPYVEALSTEVLVALDAARFCAETAFSFLRDEPLSHGNLMVKAKRGRLVREPHGVIGIISPWNYPFSIPATETLAALVTGNAVVLKPSELTPLVALELQSLLHEAGVPKDIFQVVVGEGPTGAALLSSSIDKLVFTGSVPTGKRVAEAAAKRLLPVVLELGGKDAMLVLNDAHLEIAASAAVWGAFMNAGQTCLSVERCYVHRALYDKFLALVVAKAKRLRVGNGLDPNTDVGPLINDRQLQVVESQIEEAKAQGAKVLAGGMRLPEVGPTFYTPTVITNVDHSMRLMREETFGPVLPVMPFETDEEALRLANDSEFALAASIWTKNRKHGERLARQIDAGTVMINDVLTCFGISEAPHGGFKASGIGLTHGRFGLDEMVRIKYVDNELVPGLAKPWWYPYGPECAPQVEGAIEFLFGRALGKRIRGGLRAASGLLRNRT